MKKLMPLLLVLLVSCTVPNYYQVYKASTDTGTLSASSITFEDESLLITYNLWSVGGDISFNIYNKSAEDVTINVDKSFFVLNGFANDYYKNRVYTKSTNVSTIVAPVNPLVPTNVLPGSSSGYSTTYSESPVMTIPSKTTKRMSEYVVNNTYYDNCDLPDFPAKRNIKAITFTNETSPFVFYNIINYTVKGVTKNIENHFYVSEITNLPETEMIKLEKATKCGKNTGLLIKTYPKSGPDKFYLQYFNVTKSK